MSKHDLMVRKTKNGEITVVMLASPVVKKHFTNCGEVTWDVRTNAQDKCTDNDTPTQDRQD